MIALVAVLLALGPDETVVVKGGRILTMKGEEIRDGIILIVGGRIQKIGRDLEIPAGATTIDASGRTIIPGLIDAASTLGIEGSANEDGSEVTPDVRILEMIDPSSRELARARQCGITSVFVGPGNRNVIGGLAAIIKTQGTDRKSILLREDAALKAAMGGAPTAGNYPPRGTAATFYARRPTTRMGVVWEFKKAFVDAREGGNAVLRRAMEGKLPVRVAASRATDIESLLKISDELGLSIVLEEAQEAYKLADALASRKIPVLLRPEFSAEGSEGSEVRFDAFRRLVDKGVRVALLPVQADNPDSLLGAAALAVKHGATRDEALRAVTIGAAEILGVADRVGNLEEGKDADLVILSGDPLDLTSRVETVVIAGRVVFGKRSDR